MDDLRKTHGLRALLGLEDHADVGSEEGKVVGIVLDHDGIALGIRSIGTAGTLRGAAVAAAAGHELELDLVVTHHDLVLDAGRVEGLDPRTADTTLGLGLQDLLGEAGSLLVELGEGLVLRSRGTALETERAVADGTHLADGEGSVGRTALSGMGLGDEDGVAAAGIHPQDGREVGEVDIRAEDVDGRSAGTPDVMVLGLRAAGRIVAGALVLRLDDPGVDEGRQVVLGLAGSGDLVHVGSIVPGHEDLVGAVALAEDFLPGAGGLAAALLPGVHGLGQQGILVGDEPVHELGGHGAGESGVGGRAVVTGVAVEAHFVLHLDHDDGLVHGIDLLDMLHHGGVGLAVGFGRRHAEGAQDRELLALLGECGRILGIVLLDPDRVVGAHAVLPAAEPEDGELEVVGTGGLDHLVDDGEVELALHGLDLLPGHDGEDGIHAAFLEVLPERLHVGRAGGGGVAELAREGEERLTLDDQLGDGTPLLEMGLGKVGGGRRLLLRSSVAGGQDERCGAQEKGCKTLHGYWLIISDSFRYVKVMFSARFFKWGAAGPASKSVIHASYSGQLSKKRKVPYSSTFPFSSVISYCRMPCSVTSTRSSLHLYFRFHLRRKEFHPRVR